MLRRTTYVALRRSVEVILVQIFAYNFLYTSVVFLNVCLQIYSNVIHSLGRVRSVCTYSKALLTFAK